MFFSALGNFVALDDKFDICSSEQLAAKLSKDKTNYFWNRKKQPSIKNCVDLSEILNWHKIDEFEKIPQLYNSSCLERFVIEQSRIKAILSSCNLLGIYLGQCPMSSLIPKHIAREFVLRRNELLKELFEWISRQDFYDNDLIFSFKNIKTDVINQLNFDLNIKDGKFKTSFLYAENFRFKADKNSLNLFTLQKDQRDILIPQDENSFIYCCDFKQFEFRTYFLLNPHLNCNFDTSNIYDNYTGLVGLPLDQTKIECIAYLYGKKNNKLDKILGRQHILSKIHNQRFISHGQHVIVRNEHEEGKKIHTIIQSISQFVILEKLDKILNLLKGKKSSFLYPHHDNFVFSINNEEQNLIPKIKTVLEDEVYKVKEYKGQNFRDLVAL